MPKFFVVSDVHGFFDELQEALINAGFDPNNEEHWLIGCGDYFDRGKKPYETMKFLQKLPRKVLVRGNHEDLLVDCCVRRSAKSHDVHNGTAATIKELGKNDDEKQTFGDCCNLTLDRTDKFMCSLVDYFETKNYIFVHSFVPLTCKDNYPAYYIEDRKFEKNDDWRNASADDWYTARWGNPYLLADDGLLPEKTLVFGHFHTSYPRAYFEGGYEWGEEACFDPYYGKGYIAIDGCTAYTGKVNVLVLEDDFLEERK